MRAPDLILLHAPSVYDFRRESILYGPVSDMVPSTPVFEMYPIGFTTIAEYLERHGLRTRIINLAVRMLNEPNFDVEHYLKKLDAAAFGIDLHWLPHAHGSIEVERIAKRLHPRIPVIFGGFSATYFHQELIRYPQVDFVLRGDMTELPMLRLMQYIRAGGSARPAVLSGDAAALAQIPNLVWKDADGQVTVNPIAYAPDTLDDVLVDYSYVIKSVIRYRDLASLIPFKGWMRYPITAAFSVHGCRFNCTTCGGSAYAYRQMHGRSRPVYRAPEALAEDIRKIGEFSQVPVFVLCDIRQAGDEYAERFLEAISGYERPVMFEFFEAPPRGFFQRMARALKNFTVEISMESHDERVRRAFGRPYSNAEIERAMDEALHAGCQRLDLFFMVGLKEQTYDSVMGTVDYARRMVARYADRQGSKLVPFISPMAPFLDPGSRAFDQPEKHGYRLFARTLEEHRQALVAPSWKYVLNYETRWLSRDGIVDATYEAGRRMNRLKAEYGLIETRVAEVTERRIDTAVALMKRIDQIMQIQDMEQRRARLLSVKGEVDCSNQSTVCDKRELELPMSGFGQVNLIKAAGLAFRSFIKEWQR